MWIISLDNVSISNFSIFSVNSVSIYQYIGLPELVSFDGLDFFNDDSDDDGSDSGSAGTCNFTFRFDEFFGGLVAQNS